MRRTRSASLRWSGLRLGRRVVLSLTLVATLGLLGATSCITEGSYRPVVTARNGMVAAAHPLASLAGVRVLMQGGNAIDAGIATAAAIAIVEPNLSSMGGGGGMLIYHAKTGTVKGIICDGPVPAAGTLDKYDAKTANQGYLAGIVPGALAGWAKALEMFGTMSFAQVFAPAIELADQGFPVTERLASTLNSSLATFKAYPSTGAIFMKPGGAKWKTGDILVEKDTAATYRKIAEKGADVFYKGEIAEKIIKFYKENGGLFTMEDLANYQPLVVDLLKTDYRGYELYMLGHTWGGPVVIEELNVAEGFDLAALGAGTADSLHAMIETTKLAGADLDTYLADPKFVSVPFDMLTSKKYAEKQRARIDPKNAAVRYTAGRPEAAGTTQIAVVDKEGNMFAFTTSIGSGWGTGVRIPEVGCFFNNGTGWMNLDPKHINVIAPGKLPFNNSCPVLAFKDGKPFLCIGTPGGNAIWQTMFQMMVNIIDFKMNIQDAIEAPRYNCTGFGENNIRLEKRFSDAVLWDLVARGHRIRMYSTDFTSSTGGVQGIMIDPETRALLGGADPRRDGYVVGW